MGSLRTTLLCALALLAFAAFAIPATGAKTPAKIVPQIVFPLIGDVEVDDNYGDPRANGKHAGIDMMTPRRTPVVAAEAGKLRWWTTSARAGCMLYLYGESGTTYLYIHLNNDRSLRNDNRAGCVAGSTYTAADGARVTAGQLIAWSGDSGDADGNPHLHFELHPDDGPDVNPFKALVEGERLLFPGRLGSRFTVGVRGSVTAVGAGKVTISASAVRWWPGGRWSEIGARDVVLTLAAGAKVDESLAGLAAGAATEPPARVASAEVTAFTAPAKVTADALRGVPGVLVAARVSRQGGSLVEVESNDDASGTTSEPDPSVPPRPF
ncbi:MAG: M23 family metallopeptidase [Gaiellales bacterium]